MSRSLSGFGDAYELRVGPAAAKKLLGAANLPKMGYEVLLKRLPDLGGTLALQNISGSLVLASCTHPQNDWLSVFGIDPASPGQPLPH